jgi:hypothetical protein
MKDTMLPTIPKTTSGRVKYNSATSRHILTFGSSAISRQRGIIKAVVETVISSVSCWPSSTTLARFESEIRSVDRECTSGRKIFVRDEAMSLDGLSNSQQLEETELF